MSSSIHIFTHGDLDGVGSLLLLTWAFPDSEISFSIISNTDKFEEEFKKINNSKPLHKFQKIFITDLSIKQEHIPLIDKPNVIYIDHHKTSKNLVFTTAKTFISEYTSCILYIYNLFKSSLQLTTYQKQLLVLIDDYDSYALKFKNSKILNTLYWAHYKDSVLLFLSDFKDGFKNFNTLQQNAINLHNLKIDNIIKNLPLYSARLTIQDIEQLVVSAFAEDGINDVAEYILNKYKANIAIVVNLKSNRVSFRSKNTVVDVSVLAQKLCNGGGHYKSSGGAITDKFLMFSKTFTPITHA